MSISKFLKGLGAGLLGAGLLALPANLSAKEIKIGVIYDYSGPLAAGGSSLQALGAKIMIDYFNSIGGVEGYKINAIYADAQSKPEIAINEAVRLIEQENVDMLMGFYSSAQCVPVSAKVDAMKKFMWITTCISPAVLKDRHLEHVFRPQPHGGMFGMTSPDMVAHYAKSKLGVDPKDLKVAIIHEDGPYGSGVAGGNEQGSKKHGFKIVLKEGYAATSPDLSSLVTKLKRKRPDVIFHTGYNPDISLFLRQSRELGLKWKALIGHGAGYGVPDKLYEAVGDDANFIFNVDPVSIWLIDPATLTPGLGKVTEMVGVEYKKARPKVKTFSAHVGMAASNVYTFFDDVLPRAIKKHGGISSEALRKAAAETNIPIGGTLMGYGVKFEPKSSDMAGQNNDAFPVVVQYTNGDAKIAWPTELQTTDPVLSLPKSSPYSK
ncbi:ABC transporter substrate-binding protein [Alphaproteobacteria bacterium]|jgi:branched-chain amino acid transport system substrate-binding protein|nr:ABC transporter substrate-binding protein [Alphaproteobacteria bacterium]|tara:strand:- start:3033 stop:4337 length:1305 start_codon:yes stop_codon:yes gene_type:complete